MAAKETASLGHLWDEHTVVTDPEGTEKDTQWFCDTDHSGKQLSSGHHRLCKRDAKDPTTYPFDNGYVCDHVSDSEPHAYGQWHILQEATKEADGLRVHYCQDCGYMEEEVIPMTGLEEVEEGRSAGNQDEQPSTAQETDQGGNQTETSDQKPESADPEAIQTSTPVITDAGNKTPVVQEGKTQPVTAQRINTSAGGTFTALFAGLVSLTGLAGLKKRKRRQCM